MVAEGEEVMKKFRVTVVQTFERYAHFYVMVDDEGDAQWAAAEKAEELASDPSFDKWSELDSTGPQCTAATEWEGGS